MTPPLVFSKKVPAKSVVMLSVGTLNVEGGTLITTNMEEVAFNGLLTVESTANLTVYVPLVSSRIYSKRHPRGSVTVTITTVVSHTVGFVASQCITCKVSFPENPFAGSKIIQSSLSLTVTFT